MPSSTKLPTLPPPEIKSRAQLKDFQRFMAATLYRPLDGKDRMQRTWKDGRSMKTVASSFIKRNDRMTSFERLEIYNQTYWFRVLDCLYDDYPGLRAILGERKFGRLARAYLTKYPSASFTLRNLGQRLEQFVREEPEWILPHSDLALDMIRFEWAQINAFDGEARPVMNPEQLQSVKPSRLRLGLQPYLTLLKVNYAVDDFAIALKRQGAALRSEASNALTSAPKAKRARKVMRPKKEKSPLYIVVQRYQNGLYYKRLQPEAFQLLRALQAGYTLTQACDRTLQNFVKSNPNWTAEVQNWFANWSALGWFCARTPSTKK